jgi:hypothetical protein
MSVGAFTEHCRRRAAPGPDPLGIPPEEREMLRQLSVLDRSASIAARLGR